MKFSFIAKHRGIWAVDWAHKKVQFEIVCVLALIAMFTHMHIFWIAGLLLALVDFPDFGVSFRRIASSLERIAGVTRRAPTEGVSHDGPPLPDTLRADEVEPSR